MKKKFIFFLLFPLFLTSQNQTNNYISIGFLDHKTGNSVIGYTRSILQNTNNEVFVLKDHLENNLQRITFYLKDPLGKPIITFF